MTATTDPYASGSEEQVSHAAEGQKGDYEKSGAAVNEKSDNVAEEIFTEPVEELPHGVRLAEAMTASWTSKEMIFLYVWALLILFVQSLCSQMTNYLSTYVTSSFASNPLTAIILIPANILSGIWRMPLAKILDCWGRAQGYAFMTLTYTLSLVMMAACKNVETYAAAYVFYWVSYDAILYIINVIVADTSSLRNRAFWFAYMNSPFIVTAWLGSYMANSLTDNGTNTHIWRWGYGAVAIVTPVIAIPFWYVIWNAQRRALKVVPYVSSGRTLAQNIKHYFIEFDVFGIILICAAWVLFLLPFGLETYQKKGWHSALVIAMWVIGLLCFPAFAVWEKWYAPKRFIPYNLLVDRTVITACLLAMVLYISFYIWDSYFYDFLMIVYGLNATDAGYILEIYTVGSCIFGLLVGFLVRWTNHFRWLAWTAAPIILLFSGLMIKFRDPSSGVGLTVMCQIFIAFAGGTLVICEQMAVMAASPHVSVASILALEAMFTSPGASIGEAISGAIYTHVFPKELLKELTAIGQADLEPTIYASIYTQLAYPMGNSTRDAIIGAYATTQKYLTIASTCVMVLAPVLVAFWRNYNVGEIKQVKGRLA